MHDWFVWPFFGVIGLLSLVGLGLWLWALVDCIQVPDDSMYESGNKLVWVLIIVLLNWIGAILYFLIGRPKGRGPKDRAPEPRSGNEGPSLPPPPPGAR
jgi:hypothetical protein